MPRNISDTLKTATNAAQTAEVLLVLVEIDHDYLITPIRIVDNTQDIISNGYTYTGFPFKLSLPSEEKDNPRSAKITISNVDRSIIATLRTLTTSPDFSVGVIRAANPDNIEMGWYYFKLKDISYTVESVSGTLVYENKLDYNISSEKFLPQDFPSLHQWNG